jgi:hypothetical protein
MFRPKDSCRVFGLSIALVLLLIALSVPASGGAVSADKAASQPAVGSSGSDPANGWRAPQATDVPSFAVPEGGACRADTTPETLPAWARAGGRTCRCSCGYPCKTDADCGGGIGSCRGGISCC